MNNRTFLPSASVRGSRSNGFSSPFPSIDSPLELGTWHLALGTWNLELGTCRPKRGSSNTHRFAHAWTKLALRPATEASSDNYNSSSTCSPL
jgi:hypothetical protein